MDRDPLNRFRCRSCTRAWMLSATLAAALAAAMPLPAAGQAATGPAEVPESETPDPGGRLNLPTPTLGGMQLWTDELIYRGLRIQRHALTRHCRLLDERDVRQAWGTFEECQARLKTLAREQSLTPLEGKVVILLHGLGRSRDSMQSLADYLDDQSTMTAISFGYASTRNTLEENARALRSVIDHLGPSVREIYLVGHSLGNIVVRRYLQTPMSASLPRPVDPRIRRMVMLGPPNRGSALAAWFEKQPLARAAVGDTLSRLAEPAAGLDEERSIPPFEFGIIAGGMGDQEGLNRLLEGDDDLLVKVEETKLAGARDFTVVPVVHGLLMDDPGVHQMTLRFLQEGYFRSPLECRPILPIEIAVP